MEAEQESKLSSLKNIELVLLSVLHVVDDGRTCVYADAIGTIQNAEQQLNRTLYLLNAHNGGVTASIEIILRVVGRMHVIQETSYISEGYALMDATLCLIFALMTATDWAPGAGVAVAYTVVITFLFTYLRLLVSDLEDPFEFPKGYCALCYSEGKSMEIGAWDELSYGGSIRSMVILTVTFGQQLKELLIREKGMPSESPVIAEAKYDPPVQSAIKETLAHFRLFFRCIPVVAFMIGIRLAVWYGFHTGGWLDQSIFTSFISLAIFVSAVMMQGLLQDYKEAEKMPSELASAFFGITNAVAIQGNWAAEISGSKVLSGSDLDHRRAIVLLRVRDALSAVFDVLHLPNDEEGPVAYLRAMEKIDDAQTELSCFQLQVERKVATWFGEDKSVYPGAKLDKPFEQLRAILGRMYAIQKTSYILEGYTLMDLMIVGVAVLMSGTDWPAETHAGTAFAFTVAISSLFAYLQFFCRFLEDPFDYPEDYAYKCYNEDGNVQTSIYEDHWYSGSINMRPLTVVFSQSLKEQIRLIQTQQQLVDEAQLAQSRVARKGISRDLFVSSPRLEYQQIPDANSEHGEYVRHRRRSSISIPALQVAVNDSVQKSLAIAPMYGTVYMIQRLRLVVQALPFVACMIALRLCLWYGVGVGGWVDSTVFLKFVFLVIFVTSFLLQSVIMDYKEAERFPCQVATALQVLTNALCFACDTEKKLNATNLKFRETSTGSSNLNYVQQGKDRCNETHLLPDTVTKLLAHDACMREVETVYLNCLKFLQAKEQDSEQALTHTMEEICRAEMNMFEIFQTVDKKGKIEFLDGAWDVVGPLFDVRKLLARANVIRRTWFCLDGYALVDGMLLAVLVLLALTDWPLGNKTGTALGCTIILSGLFVYMSLLIRSLENPFHYPSSYCTELSESVRKESFSQRQKSIFSWIDAFVCGNPIDVSPLVHIFGIQLYRLVPSQDTVDAVVTASAKSVDHAVSDGSSPLLSSLLPLPQRLVVAGLLNERHSFLQEPAYFYTSTADLVHFVAPVLSNFSQAPLEGGLALDSSTGQALATDTAAPSDCVREIEELPAVGLEAAAAELLWSSAPTSVDISTWGSAAELGNGCSELNMHWRPILLPPTPVPHMLAASAPSPP